MLFTHALLWACLIACCYGLPTEEEIMHAIEKSSVENTLKRGLNKLFSSHAEPQVSSCPHMMARFHGKRSSADPARDKRTNDLIAAAQMLLAEGHTLEDLQHEDVKRVFQRQTNDCPAVPTCATPTGTEYRSADGSCNNKNNPAWGQAGQAQSRIVDPAYADGVSNPRSESVLGGALPNPRTVSNGVHAAPGGPEVRATDITLHAFQMGQFLDHDVIATPTQSVVDDCCTNTASSDVANCLSILVPQGDPNFNRRNGEYCMGMKRSAPLFCPDASSRREQMNALTSFVDASNVYGSSLAEQTALRDNNGQSAFLKTENPGNRLPNNPDNDNCISNVADGVHCSLAGDHRVNVVPSLTSYHTLFVREHNRIATALRDVYTNDEELFQETRKVLIGVMQKIVYDEFLPSFLSPTAMETYKLASSNDYSYDNTVDPTISNAFGIAFRFGHTWIPRNMDVFRRDLRPFLPFRTEDTYNRPDITYISESPDDPNSVNGMDGLLYWLTAVPSPDTDRIVEDAARNRLFQDGRDAFDLVSLNIQRGRDHGLPSYNDFRNFCGLSTLTRQWVTQNSQNGGLTNHSPELITSLRAVYQSPQDIDLFTGALTETAVAGGGVGPTLDCLLGDQFGKLKFGDRFWYQGVDNGFTSEQQAEIQKASMARILCDNFGFARVHRNAFVRENLVQCNNIESMDLSKFGPAAAPTQAPPATQAPPQPQPPNGGGQGGGGQGGGGQGGGGQGGGGQGGGGQGGGGQNGRPRDLQEMLEELLHELE